MLTTVYFNKSSIFLKKVRSLAFAYLHLPRLESINFSFQLILIRHSDQTYLKVYSSLNDIHHALNKLGASSHFIPFLTLSFLALPVIPELKLTDMGLFLVSKFEHISIEPLS
ncbi:adenine deaminase C-terminal domain-containing protein [Bacillota bacterium Lsc_1132]